MLGRPKEQRAAVRAFIRRHRLTKQAMAAHCGIAYPTLMNWMSRRNEELSQGNWALVEAGLAKEPVTRSSRSGKYDKVVAEMWGHATLDEIVIAAGAKRRQDVEQVAHRLGLRPHANPRRKSEPRREPDLRARLLELAQRLNAQDPPLALSIESAAGALKAERAAVEAALNGLVADGLLEMSEGIWYPAA